MRLLSSRNQLQNIRDLIRNYLRLPFGANRVPGNLLEALLEEVRGGACERLATYDFVDVIDRDSGLGWQVKSLNHDTPVTWIRGKISNKQALIEKSLQSDADVQVLGNAILAYCNQHVSDSLEKYGLRQLGYVRLINYGDTLTYFERPLILSKKRELFRQSDYTWKWSIAKKTTSKEQLPALHGTHIASGVKHFAWHGQGENQLHFTGERTWWPRPDDPHAIAFNAPSAHECVTPKVLAEWLSKL